MPSVDVVSIHFVGEENMLLGTPSNSARDAGTGLSGNLRSLFTPPPGLLDVDIPPHTTPRTPLKQTSNAGRDRASNLHTTSAWPTKVAKRNAHFSNLVNDTRRHTTPTSVDDESLGASSDVESVRRVLFAHDNPPAVPFTRDAASAVRSSALDVRAIHPYAPIIQDAPHRTDEDVLEVISPEVAWDSDAQDTSDSGITENDAENFSHDTLPTNEDTTNETDGVVRRNAEHSAEESQRLSQNEAAFTESVIGALSSAFAANDDNSGLGTSLPSSPSAPPTTRQRLFLESLSDDEFLTPEREPEVVASRPVPTREPQANLRVSRPVRASTVDDTKGAGVHVFDKCLDGEDATYAYDKTTNTPPLQGHGLPPAPTRPPEPVILSRGQYKSVTEHFLQRVEEWFGADALKELDQEMLDGPSKNIRKGLSSTKPPTLASAEPSRRTKSTEVFKRKRVISPTPEQDIVKDPRTIKKPRILEDSDKVHSCGNLVQRHPGPDDDLLEKFIERKGVPTDEEVNKVNLLISRLDLIGEHDVYEGKTSSNAYFRVMVPKVLVASHNLA